VWRLYAGRCAQVIWGRLDIGERMGVAAMSLLLGIVMMWCAETLASLAELTPDARCCAVSQMGGLFVTAELVFRQRTSFHL